MLCIYADTLTKLRHSSHYGQHIPFSYTSNNINITTIELYDVGMHPVARVSN
jgi:hypothetical protein